MELNADTAPGPITVCAGIAIVAGGLFLIWYASRPAPAGAVLEKVAETIKETTAAAEKVVETVAP